MARTSKTKDVEGLEGAVGKKALRYVEIKFLNVDPSYQRGLVAKHRLIATSFDKDAFGTPIVGQRDDGSLWIVDGRQRIEALKILGKKKVRADVFASRGPEHEAHIFKLINKNRTSLNSVELFRAALAEGDKDAHAVRDIVYDEGFKIDKSKLNPKDRSAESQATTISAIGKLLEIYKYKGRTKGGERALRFILRTIAQAWLDDPLRVKLEVLGGLGRFYSDMGGTIDVEGGTIDPDRLIPRLQLVTPAKLIYSATMGVGDRYANVAEAIVKVYRKRTGKRM